MLFYFMLSFIILYCFIDLYIYFNFFIFMCVYFFNVICILSWPKVHQCLINLFNQSVSLQKFVNIISKDEKKIAFF